MEVELSGEQFKKLIKLGRVTHIGGYIYTEEDAEDLRLGRKGTIRPPIDTIFDEDEIHITEIQIITDIAVESDDDSVDLVAFNLQEVAALVKIL